MSACLSATRFAILLRVLAASVICAASVLEVQSVRAATCESLSMLSLPNTTIATAQIIPAGTFITPPNPYGGESQPERYKNLPTFCRVAVEIRPSPDSSIKIEVWMPVTGWNGRYRGQGNGGFAGSIGYSELGDAVRRGYATAGTDQGHWGTSGDSAWALGHPEKVIDFGYRAIHEMTLTSKAVIRAFYGKSPEHSYFVGCSDGGREGLMEAQRFPEDYDGIVAGDPANYFTHLVTGGMWVVQVTAQDPASYIPASKVPAISAAVLAACDAQDGLKDGILSEPSRCQFNPDTMVCKKGDAHNCLTVPQAAALKKIYAGPHDSTGHRIFPGYTPGGEEGPTGWALWLISGEEPGRALWVANNEPGRSVMSIMGSGYFSHMVYERADWNPKSFNLDRGVKDADAKTARVLNAIDPNLRAFKARGGKAIIYHGWSDPAIPPLNSVDYYTSVVTKMGLHETDSFLRLFLVPGMQHCEGGPGPDSFGQEGTATPEDHDHNIYMAIERWVERGEAPSTIIATKYVDDSNPAKGVRMTRPLCPYPQVAKYKGSGSTDDALNFACTKE
jgi:tannase/feruloyl esterase